MIEQLKARPIGHGVTTPDGFADLERNMCAPMPRYLGYELTLCSLQIGKAIKLMRENFLKGLRVNLLHPSLAETNAIWKQNYDENRVTLGVTKFF